jgi:Fe(3+) dicitrate transport protein
VISGYTTFNTAINYHITPWGATIFATVKNLADRQYIADRTRGIRPGALRLVQAGFRWDF